MRLSEDRKEGDTRVFLDSEYFLPREYVDRFANEVRGRRGPALRKAQGSDVDDSDISDLGSVEGDPTDGLQAPITRPSSPSSLESRDVLPADGDDGTAALIARKLMDACVVNWKANSSEEKKKMWAVFDETGIFVAACRHGIILWAIDMIRSGEL